MSNLKNIAIVTDSSSGLTKEECKKLNVFVIPLFLNFSDGVHDLTSYFDFNNTLPDKEQITHDIFYQKVQKEKLIPKTSQTPMGIISQIWSNLLKDYKEIIFIPISKLLSSQYQTALILSKEEEFLNKVFVFDSEGVGLINKLMVLKSLEMSKLNQTKESIIKELERIKNNYFSLFIPYDFKTIMKGGRINLPQLNNNQKIDFSSLKLIFSFNKGKIEFFNHSKSWEEAIRFSLDSLKNISNQKENVLYISHGCNYNLDLLNKVKMIAEAYNYNEIKIDTLPFVLLSHTGLNTIVLIVSKNK
jgi:DegV family protein with EDD domain